MYLLYTSYSLCKGYVTGEEGTSMGFMLAGIAFAAIGAGLLFSALKICSQKRKSGKQKQRRMTAMEAAAGGELEERGMHPGRNRSMSIAERANMVKNLEDEEEDGKTRKNENIDHIAETVVFLPALLMMYIIFSFSAHRVRVSGNLSYKISYENHRNEERAFVRESEQ